MKKLKLSPNEQILLYNFLKWACKEEPTNFSEWGEQYVRCCNIYNGFELYVTNGVLNCSENEAWAIHNYFAAYVDEIYRNKLGEVLFVECRDLFVRISDELWGLKHDPSIFIPPHFNLAPGKPVFVNPLENPERYLD